MPITAPRANLKFHRLWLALGIGLVALLLYGSLAPAQALPSLGGSDKLWHGACYAVVMAYFSQIYGSLKSRIYMALGLIALGVIIEFIQPYVNRNFDWFDALANAMGVSAALAASFSPLNNLLRWVDDRLKKR